ncbi:MAG: multicopper oxidase domain-containing protein [Acidobacteriaceae bacterium]|nr:multicopper oxidase domain-containing protein [Acidobacteriaceae bacterium]
MAVWTRRRLLGNGCAAMSSAAFPQLLRAAATQSMGAGQMLPESGERAQARTLNAARLTPFVDRLPAPERARISALRSDSRLGAVNAPCYQVSMRRIQAQLHRDLPRTTLWSYGRSAAPVLWEARSHEGLLIDWKNDLPREHILTLGEPMPGMHDAPATRTVTHVHGARVPSVSDGYPEDWFGPGEHRLCYYPNQQDAAALWVHDHAMGVSRMNVIAGLIGWYIVRDREEEELRLPSDAYEHQLFLYDRSFTPEGQLYYPNPPDEGAWAQEFLGDAILVNGKVQPFLEVEPRKYRFRIGNVANSRFFSLSLSSASDFYVIGTDQGLLSEPVQCARVVLAPSERTDLIIDFSAMRGRNITLMSDNMQLMQFRVSSIKAVDDSRLPDTLRQVISVQESSASQSRFMTLDEFDSDTGDAETMLLNRKHWSDPVTEIVQQGTTEIWSFANLTQDAHPIHLHLVQFQILDRQPFSVDDYLTNESVRFTGERLSPHSTERGWKDVVQCPPGTITRIAIPFVPYAGRYLWHCHILEHEANDMMRPYVIKA